MRLDEVTWEREALHGPATRTWWGRGPGEAIVRVTEVSTTIGSAEARVEAANALAEAAARWGPLAHPSFTLLSGERGDIRVACAVETGARTLADRMRQAPLGPEAALEWVLQVAERLAEWHERGASHGFLRPETVLLEGDRALLLEPRLHAAAAETLLRGGAVLPYDPYAAPEPDRYAVEGLPADVYALGVLLVHLIAGRAALLPVPGGLASSPLFEALPGPLQRTVEAALHPDPAQRLPGAQKFGLYLRVHRMWSASWDWAPLSAFSTSANEDAPAPPAAVHAPEHGPPPEPGAAVADTLSTHDFAPTEPAPEIARPAAGAIEASQRQPGPDAPEWSLSAPAAPHTDAASAGDEEPSSRIKPAPAVWPSWLPRLSHAAPSHPPSTLLTTPTAAAAGTNGSRSVGTAETQPDAPVNGACVSEGFEGSDAPTAGPVEARTPALTSGDHAPPLAVVAPLISPSTLADPRPAIGPELTVAASAPSAAGPGPGSSLLLEAQVGRVREQIPIAGESAQIGRRDPARGHYPAIDLRADDAVSRRHAEIRRTTAGWVVVDLGSTNGTRLNGAWLEALHEAPLADGDEIELGAMTTLRVHLQ